MQKEIEHVLSFLTSDDGLAEAVSRVDEWGRAARVDHLVALAKALEGKAGAREEALSDQVEDQLALVPKGEAIDALLALATRPRTQSRVRSLASRLGYAQRADDFLATLEKAGDGPQHVELLACWMHEVVLRGTSLAEDARAKRFQERLVREGHPLASMPLETLGVEREVHTYLPLYGDRGIGAAIEALESGSFSARTVPPPADGAAIRVTRAADAAVEKQLSAAVAPWTEGGKGRVEAKVFTVEPAVSSAGSWLLRALALESTTGVARLDVSSSPPEEVFGALFAAASNGGASSDGLGGAYGRRAAWTSLSALTGASGDFATIANAAARCAFLSFRAAGPWFYDVAWDLGLLCVREGGKTIAVLAATDDE